MPQNSASKKKKGRAPAHQNAYAFVHNPKSKKTAKILEMPIQHVCRRCRDKLEWRKKYRKYKIRTQPGKCNVCQQRCVMAAYHTICEKCTLSEKAKNIVKEHLASNPTTIESTDTVDEKGTKEEIMEEEETEPQEEVAAEEPAAACSASVSSSQQQASATSTPATGNSRACAMCVKDYALPDSDDEDEGDYLANAAQGGKRLTLRQVKTIERQKENAKKKRSAKNNDDQEEDEDSDSNNDNENRHENNNDDSDDDDMDMEAGDDSDEEDPFLKAVGGADKLLTGESYQQALLQKEKEQQMQRWIKISQSKPFPSHRYSIYTSISTFMPM